MSPFARESRYMIAGRAIGAICGFATFPYVWRAFSAEFGLLGLVTGWLPAALAALGVVLAVTYLWAPALLCLALVALHISSTGMPVYDADLARSLRWLIHPTEGRIEN